MGQASVIRAATLTGKAVKFFSRVSLTEIRIPSQREPLYMGPLTVYTKPANLPVGSYKVRFRGGTLDAFYAAGHWEIAVPKSTPAQSSEF